MSERVKIDTAMSERVRIYTDGACSGKPGRARGACPVRASKDRGRR